MLHTYINHDYSKWSCVPLFNVLCLCDWFLEEVESFENHKKTLGQGRPKKFAKIKAAKWDKKNSFYSYPYTSLCIFYFYFFSISFILYCFLPRPYAKPSFFFFFFFKYIYIYPIGVPFPLSKSIDLRFSWGPKKKKERDNILNEKSNKLLLDRLKKDKKVRKNKFVT